MARRIIAKLPIKRGEITEQMIVCPVCGIPRANNRYNYPSPKSTECKWCLTAKHSEANRETYRSAHNMSKKFINSRRQKLGLE